MDRRVFLTSSACAAAAAAAGGPAFSQAEVKKIGAGLRTKIAINPRWFKGSPVQQIEQVAAYGFPAFEFLGAGRWPDKETVRRRCQELGVECGAIGGGMGTITKWGPNDPETHPRFVEAVKQAIQDAKALGGKVLLALSGPDRKGVSKEEQMDALVRAGRLVAPMIEDAGMILVWECLNVLVNHPGYFLVYSKDGAELVRRTDRPCIKFLFDIYHQQISEGNLIRNIQAYIKEIGHFHFADNPGRHEPGTGEINYKNVFKAIHEAGYQGIVACEFSFSKRNMPVEKVLEILAECDRWES